jgi:signal transduction histidine kinase
LCLRFEATSTYMEISDDGVGFEPVVANLSGGYGLSGMEERAQRIGGSLHVESAPGAGTRISVRVNGNSRDNGGVK